MQLSRQQQQLQEIVQQSLLRNYTTKSQAKLSQSFNPNAILGQSHSPTHKTNQSQGIDSKIQKRQTPTAATRQYQQELLKLMTSHKQFTQVTKSGVNRSDIQKPTSQTKQNQKLSTSPSQANTLFKSLTQLQKQEEQNTITLIVHYENQQIKFQVEGNRNTGWLEEYLKKEVKKSSIHQHSSTGSQPNEVIKTTCGTGHDTTDQEIVAFHTVEKNLPVDYYLQQPAKPLDIFKGQTLNLQPFFGTPQMGKVTLKDFIFVKCIGVGGFSRVYLVKKKSNGRFYAMKLIDKEFILENKKQSIVQNERDIMTVLDHPFIIKLEYSFESKNFIVFVLEFCSGGELFVKLRSVKQMTEEQARFYFSEICLAMFYLHSLSVVYRDLKPENIMIDIDGHIRMGDFGLSKPNMTEEDYAYSFCGSPEYMAPEMILKLGHTIQVDHYTLGALLYELVTGLPPFYSRDTDEIYQSILSEELTFPERVHLSAEIKDLLNGLLCKQVENRLGSNGGVAEILSHAWFKEIDLVALLQKKIPPPLKQNPLKFNYEHNDLMKGELETREKLLGRAGLQQEIRLFKAFYFDASEQKQMKIEQQKIFKQHFQLVQKQQLMMQQRYFTRKSTEPKEILYSKPQSPSTASRGGFHPGQQKSNTKSDQINSLQKRIKSQQSSMGTVTATQITQISNIHSPSNSKMLGLKRIISQNNFFVDRQNTLPAGQNSRDNIDYQTLLQTPQEVGLHKRVSSLKQRKK